MHTKQHQLFTTIHTEGALLPADLLQRIAVGDPTIQGLREADYHLSGETLNEAINRAWNRLQGAWAAFRTAADTLDRADPGTTITRERWLLPLFQELGYGRLLTARAVEIDGKSYPLSHGWDRVPIHLVGLRVNLDTRTAGIAGAARTSPHSIVQEFLNRSSDNVWAFVSNGLRLRVLRDNTSLTRQAFVQFDLEAMMNGELYADFVVLWLVCHQSRVEAPKLEDCWLERWARTAQEQGTRALDTLRDGVQHAIESLGRGFLKHKTNRALRDTLRAGTLSEQNYYRQLLRLVYRLLFLFAAEDRELLLDPKASDEAHARYTAYYSTRRLRDLAQRRRGTRHADLFHGLRVVMQVLGSEEGNAALALPALGSFLFANGTNGAIPDLEACEIGNHDLLLAVRELAFTVDGTVLRAVDYRNMGAEELGSVYESLLELHPRLNVDVGTFALDTVSGNDRKTTGSYYTPGSLIGALLDSALDPVLDEAARKPSPVDAILDLKICDPACGSGHFLIAAAHRVAKRLAAIETGDTEPGPEAVRSALRRVIGRCIYGVDLNPMAVELCKVSLWMEALEPGKPLSYLDHHIQIGNSLLGTTPALLQNGIPDEAFEPIEGDDKRVCSEYRKQNKGERKGQERLLGYDGQLWEQRSNLAVGMLHLDEIDDTTVEGVRRKQAEHEALVCSQDYLFGTFLADAWCAAFVWKKTKEFPYPITEQIFRNIRRTPHHVAPWMRDEIKRLAVQYGFFHWHLRFPDVFREPAKNEQSENEQAGWHGGFDVVLGNTPWERVKLQEKEWFATRNPAIAAAPNAAARKRMINALKMDDPALSAAWRDDLRKAEGESHLVRRSNRYPLTGRGDVNTYALFAETDRLLINSTGRVGCIVQSDIATADTYKDFFRNLLDTKQLVSLYDFVNTEGIFPAVHRTHPHFCLLTMAGKPVSKAADFAFWNTNVGHLAEHERHFTLTAQDLALLNPNTRTCPIFRSQRDAQLTKTIYRRVPVLIREGEQEQNSWGIRFATMFHMSNDSGLFRTREHLEADGWQLEGNVFRQGDDAYSPLYEAKLIHHFDHRWATYSGQETRDLLPNEKADPQTVALPRYWVPLASVQTRQAGRWDTQWLLGWRDITNTTNERTVIANVLPDVAAEGGVLLMMPKLAEDTAVASLLANLDALIFDFIARQKVGGTHLKFFMMRQLPILPPATYARPAPWVDATLQAWIMPRVLELTYTAWDLEAFARDCGYNGAPFRWNEERRFLLRCELDAAYFHLYGIGRDDVEYIMDTFPIVRRKDQDRHGEYRTKRVILEMYDAMQRATEAGKAYQTLLDPPPADPRVAHAAQDGVTSDPPMVGPIPHSIPASQSAPSTGREAPQVSNVAPLAAAPAPELQHNKQVAMPAKREEDDHSGNDAAQQRAFDQITQTLDKGVAGFEVGDTVRHAQWGTGQVTTVTGSGMEQIITVRFNMTTKKLVAGMARLERV